LPSKDLGEGTRFSSPLVTLLQVIKSIEREVEKERKFKTLIQVPHTAGNSFGSSKESL